MKANIILHVTHKHLIKYKQILTCLPPGTQCTGYQSPFACGCGQPGYAHVTLVETREERMARGRPVGRAVPYAAMGGLTGFSSLVDGYLRLDPSGVGNTCEQHTE